MVHSGIIIGLWNVTAITFKGFTWLNHELNHQIWTLLFLMGQLLSSMLNRHKFKTCKTFLIALIYIVRYFWICIYSRIQVWDAYTLFECFIFCLYSTTPQRQIFYFFSSLHVSDIFICFLGYGFPYPSWPMKTMYLQI